MSPKHWIVATVVLSIGIFYGLTIREGHNPGGDFAQYILHARNIVEGIRYEDTGYLYNPHYPQLGPKTYPPMYPIAIVPLIKIWGIDLQKMKIENILFFLFSLILIYLTIRDEIRFSNSLILILILGLNPFFWNFKDSVVSDMLFLCVIVLTLYYINRLYQNTLPERRSFTGVLLCGFLLYVAYGTRTAGIALLPAFFVLDWLQSKKISMFFIGSAVFFIIIVVVQNLLIHGGGSYLDQFRGLGPNIVVRNILIYIDSMVKLWDSGLPRWTFLRVLIFIPLFIFAVIGFWNRLKKIGIYELFTIFYLVLILLWPTPQGARFMIPVIPFFLFYAFWGIQKIPGSMYRRSVVCIMLLFITFSYFSKYRTLNFGPIPGGMNKKGMPEMCAWVRTQTQPTDVFVCEEPRIFALCADRHASSYFQPEKDEALLDYMGQIHAGYFAIHESEPAFIWQIIKNQQTRFELVFQNSDYFLYRFKK